VRRDGLKGPVKQKKKKQIFISIYIHVSKLFSKTFFVLFTYRILLIVVMKNNSHLTRLTFMYEMLSMMLFSLIRFIKQYPEPLSVMVRPSASLVLAISISFGRPDDNKHTLITTFYEIRLIANSVREFSQSNLSRYLCDGRIWNHPDRFGYPEV
jgi:hypothetical protein